MLHFKSDAKNYISYPSKVIKAIKNIHDDKLLFIDNSYFEILGTFRAVYQDYYKDIFYALEEGLVYYIKRNSL